MTIIILWWSHRTRNRMLWIRFKILNCCCCWKRQFRWPINWNRMVISINTGSLTPYVSIISLVFTDQSVNFKMIEILLLKMYLCANCICIERKNVNHSFHWTRTGRTTNVIVTTLFFFSDETRFIQFYHWLIVSIKPIQTHNHNHTIWLMTHWQILATFILSSHSYQNSGFFSAEVFQLNKQWNNYDWISFNCSVVRLKRALLRKYDIKIASFIIFRTLI